MEKYILSEDFPLFIDQIRSFMTSDNVIAIDVNDLFVFLEANQDHKHSYVMHYSFHGATEDICKEILKLPSDYTSALYTLDGAINFFDPNEVGSALMDHCSAERVSLKMGVKYNAEQKENIVNVYLFFKQ